MNVGIDFHGVIDLYPKFFSCYSKRMRAEGNTIHVITGMETERVVPELEKLEISYDKIFSIVDWHKNLGTEMWQREKASGRKSWYCEEETWNKSKGDYIAKEFIQLHFDDTVIYSKYVPEYCTYILVPRIGFEIFAEYLLIL